MALLRLLCLLPALWLALPASAEPAPEPATTHPNKTDQTTNAGEEAAPEPPSYYHWVDAKGHTHFSDKPPASDKHKAKKEALTPAPETGSGENLTHVYERASRIMAPPKVVQPKSGWGSQLKPATPNPNQPHQPDAPTEH